LLDHMCSLVLVQICSNLITQIFAYEAGFRILDFRFQTLPPKILRQKPKPCSAGLSPIFRFTTLLVIFLFSCQGAAGTNAHMIRGCPRIN
jgi:hypothetical protein